MTGDTRPNAGPSTASAGVLLVLVTVPAADANAFARHLIGAARAARVNPRPGVRSTYRWNGQIEEADPALMLVKTTVAGDPALERRVRAPHPNEVPDTLALPVAGEIGPCLEWLKRSVTPA